MTKKNYFDTDFIGARIKHVMIMQDKSITTLANEIHKSRSLLYDIFERRSIDSSLLMDLSLALHYNFFESLADEIDEQIASATSTK